MTKSTIPGEAVEAAARASYEQVRPRMGFPTGFEDAPEPMRETYRGLARAALEAAAPHLMASLRADLVKLAKEFDTTEGGTLAYTVTDGRHGMRKNAHDQLMYVIDDHLGGIAS